MQKLLTYNYHSIFKLLLDFVIVKC